MQLCWPETWARSNSIRAGSTGATLAFQALHPLGDGERNFRHYVLVGPSAAGRDMKAVIGAID